MAFLSKGEAAVRLGFSVELVEKLTTTCPKSSEKRLLQATDVNGEQHFDESELEAYCRYLREPWPLPENGTRPHLPEYIKQDVKAESHHGCAVCGSMDNGEVAHIEPVRETLDNSPDNLILLCPNHHTEYDYGCRASSNVTREVLVAAKKMKRNARRRLLRYEANTVGALRSLLQLLKKVEQTAKDTEDPALREVLCT